MLTESYYHDTRYPVCTLSLPQIWEKYCSENTTTTFTWPQPYEKLTAQQVYNQSMLIAKGLLSLGLKRGDTLCCFGSHGSDPVLMFYACTSLGIKFMANFLYTPAKKVMKTVLFTAQPTAVLIGTSKYAGIAIEDIFAEFSAIMEETKNDKTIHKPAHIIYDRKAEKDYNCNTDVPDWKSLSRIMEQGEKKITDDELKQAKSQVSWNEPCVYSLSSGSSGEPKLVLIGAATFASILTNTPLGFGNEFKVWGMPDMANEDFALFGQLVGVPCTQSSLVLFPVPTTPDDEDITRGLLHIIQEYKIEVYYYDQFFTTTMINQPEMREGYDLTSLKVICIAGSISTADFKKRMLQIAPLSVDIYGCTECFQLTLVTPGSLNTRPTSVGQPVPNLEVKIVDDEGKTVPINTRGQLCVRGEGFLFIEYKDLPELTSKTKDKEGWMLTGDLASMDELGYIYIYGRLAYAQRWKVASDVVYSLGIETVLRSNPNISACAVLGTVAEGTMGHHLAYVIVPIAGSQLTVAQVKEFALEKMNNSTEWPVRIFIMKQTDLPMTSGSRRKINRVKLHEMIEEKVKRDPTDGLVWDGDFNL